MPDRIEFEVSLNGVDFSKAAEINPASTAGNEADHKGISQTVTRTSARYVRIRAHNFGKIPAWHPGPAAIRGYY